MSYPKNTASPRPIRAKVVNASDGEPIESGVVAFHKHGTTRTAVAGAAEHVANGDWVYVPTQEETDYDEFTIEFYHADAVAGGPQVSIYTEQIGPPAGSMAITATVLDTDEVPIQNVLIRVYDGVDLVERQYTDAAGVATLQLNPGTYTVVATKAPLYASDTSEITVTIAAELPIELIRIGTSTSGRVTGWGYAYDNDTDPEPDVVLTIVQLKPGAKQVYNGSMKTVLSDETGLFTTPLWADGSTYQAKAGDGPWSAPFAPADEGSGLYLIPGLVSREAAS